MIHFIADLHLGHKNIIKYCKRPFKNVDEMDECLIKNWNSRIKPSDTVYLVGDVGLAKPDYVTRCLQRMNGIKHLIEGNHDVACLKYEPFTQQFETISQIKEITVPNRKNDDSIKIVMCHYAMKVWNKSHYGSYQLYGHSHGSLKDDLGSLSMDVGVDANNYMPISLDEVHIKMAKKTWKSIDYHGED